MRPAASSRKSCCSHSRDIPTRTWRWHLPCHGGPADARIPCAHCGSACTSLECWCGPSDASFQQRTALIHGRLSSRAGFDQEITVRTRCDGYAPPAIGVHSQRARDGAAQQTRGSACGSRTLDNGRHGGVAARAHRLEGIERTVHAVLHTRMPSSTLRLESSLPVSSLNAFMAVPIADLAALGSKNESPTSSFPNRGAQSMARAPRPGIGTPLSICTVLTSM